MARALESRRQEDRRQEEAGTAHPDYGSNNLKPPPWHEPSNHGGRRIGGKRKRAQPAPPPLEYFKCGGVRLYAEGDQTKF